MDKRKSFPYLIGLAIPLVLGGSLWYFWTIRTTPTMTREAVRAASKQLRASKPAEVVPFLRGLAGERRFTVRFDASAPWLHLGFETRIPLDNIAQLAEDTILRFAGNGTPGSADTANMKDALAFSADLLDRCSPEAAGTLRERRLDGFFLIDDYDGAIAIIEKGLPRKSKIWTEGTVAKLRAHKAMKAGDHAEVVRQLRIFGNYLASDEMKDFEDCDPTTGIVYSSEWVIGRNLLRCADHSRQAGDTAAAARFMADAKPYLAKALEKAKDDPPSLAELKKEMKSYGL